MKKDTGTSNESGLLKSIVLSGLILILTVVGMSIWMLREDWQGTLQQTQETALNLALSQSRQADDTYLQAELSLRQLQRDLQQQLSTGIRGTDLSVTMRELQRRLPQLHGLFYYDAQGKWIATSAAQIPANINNSDREYFSYQRTNRRNSVHIGPVIKSRSTGDLVIPVSLRVSDSMGGFRGILLATIHVDYFRRFYSYYEMGPRDVLVLMLSDSTVLYARPMSDHYIGKNLSSSTLFQQRLAQSDRGVGQWSSALDGQDRIFGYVRSERYPLIVAVGYSKHDLLVYWIKHRIQNIALSIALLAAIVVLGIFLLKQARRTLAYQRELTGLRDELSRANKALTRLAHADALTGLANRRQLDRYLQTCFSHASRSGESVSLVMLDIDFFKRYNDNYGHLAGDRCLKEVASALTRLSLRNTDLIARYGGEEFAIILPGADSHYAQQIAAQAVQAVRDLAIAHDASLLQPRHVTLSAGYATGTPASGIPAQALLLRADEALYRAKKAGRNQASS